MKKRPHWICKSHLFRRDEYICSVCGRRSPRPYVECPNCGADMTGVKSDPHWVDEMEAMDSIFDD